MEWNVLEMHRSGSSGVLTTLVLLYSEQTATTPWYFETVKNGKYIKLTKCESN